MNVLVYLVPMALGLGLTALERLNLMPERGFSPGGGNIVFDAPLGLGQHLFRRVVVYSGSCLICAVLMKHQVGHLAAITDVECNLGINHLRKKVSFLLRKLLDGRLSRQLRQQAPAVSPHGHDRAAGKLIVSCKMIESAAR